VLAASGRAGPKLRQGDKQVPEGIYRISYLNPNSAYHVSMRVNYPNRFDRRMAKKDRRQKLGGDIMIHGKKSSAGCLAMGDEAAEELFVLAAQTGNRKVKVIIAPSDMRKKGLPKQLTGQPAWVPQLYMQIASAMSEFPAPRKKGLLSFFMQ
jgi:murein L,D-transpeptidase YafK